MGEDKPGTQCLAAFLVPVEVRDCPQYGPGQKGLFAAAPIKEGTTVWEWTDLVKRIPASDLPALLKIMSREDAAIFLRQGFVLPNDLDTFNSNPEDVGHYVNHSPNFNLGQTGVNRYIEVGEELTCDYSFHGNPQWYQDICKEYGVETEAEIAEKFPPTNSNVDNN